MLVIVCTLKRQHQHLRRQRQRRQPHHVSSPLHSTNLPTFQSTAWAGRGGGEKAVAHSRQTISYTQKLNRFSAGSIIRRAVPGLIWKNVFPARNKQNLLSNTPTHIQTRSHTHKYMQFWVYSAGIKKVICYCFLSRPRISL